MSKAVQLCQTAVVLALFVGFGIAFWVMLTMISNGMGDVVFEKLSSQESHFVGLGITAGATTVALVALDVLYWKNAFWYLARLLIGANVALYFLTALAGTSRFPASPIAVYFMVCPIIVYVVKQTLLRSMDPVRFLLVVGASLMAVAFTAAGVFLAYAFAYHHWWDNDTRLDYYTRLSCIPANVSSLIPEANLTAFFKSIDIDSACDEAFLFWISPVIFAVFSFAMGGAVMTIVHSQYASAKGKAKVDMQVQAFLTFLALGFLGLWCASGIGGADQGLSTVVFTFTFLLMVIGCGAIIFVEGVDGFTSGVKKQPLLARVIKLTKSDWIRALIVVLFFPLAFIVVPLAFVNQLGRKHLPMTKELSEEERKLTLSLEIHKRIQSMRKWHWTSVLGKVIWWGFIFFSLAVIAARFVNVLFSWLEGIFEEKNVSVGAATGIFIALGWALFLLPPVPGLPIYIACSVILVPTCERDGWDFWAAWIYSTFIAWLIRMIALVTVQLLIGQMLGSNSVTVKRAININSVEMKAIRKVLMDKGLTTRKVATLVGGPEWPTAAIAGVLRTSVVQTAIGHSPIFFLILPVTLAGALLLRKNEGGAWASASSMALAITALVQVVFLLAAAYYIENTIHVHREELMSEPDDEQVKKFDEIANKRARARSYRSEWPRLPGWMKALLWLGVICETASAYLFQLAGSLCFKTFDITDSIEEQLGGNVFNLVRPLGWVGIGLVATGMIVLLILGRWISYAISGGYQVPEEVEAKQRRMSEAGLTDDVDEDDDDDDESGDKTKGAISPVSSS